MIVGGAAEAGLKVLDAAKEDKPNASLHSLRAIGLLRTKDSAGAIREAQTAFDIDPSDVDAVSLLASKKLSDGDADGALKLDALPADPKDETRSHCKRCRRLFGKAIYLRPRARCEN